MKKYLGTAIVALFAMSLSVAAQEVTETSNDANTQKIDSLTEVVNTLSSSVQKVEDEALDKRIWKDRAKYFNFYYAKQDLTQKDAGMTWKSDLAAAMAMGRTYYLHKKAILGMIKFGLDWTFFDINFGKYQDETGFFADEEDYGYGDPEKIDLYQAEVGMGIGPSVTINPVNHLKVSAHFHVTPSMSLLVVDGDVNTSYGTFMSVGGAIAYKAISIGVEHRWGTTKYNSMVDLGGFDEDYDSDIEDGDFIPKGDYDGKIKWKTGATRFYISFRY